MSGFKDMVASDVSGVFINANEFAEKRTIVYDDITYSDVPVVLTGISEKPRRQRQLVDDRVQGLYQVNTVMYCAASDLNGIVPEKDTRIKIIDDFFPQQFYVESSTSDSGMLRIELRAIDE